MTFKRIVMACVAICIMATFMVALCGCDDLGAYSNTEEYYDSFGMVTLVGGDAGKGKGYSVEEYFYNEESRENFLTDENGKYHGITHSEYVYVAIPLNRDLKMDSLAMYLQATEDVTLYISVYVTDKIPSNWKTIGENNALEYISENGSKEAVAYDDPNPETRIGEITTYLKGGKWKSFTLDSFKVNNNYEKSIQLNTKQHKYILLQIRNNSGVREIDDKTGLLVDPQTGLVLDTASITMTNLLIRAIE